MPRTTTRWLVLSAFRAKSPEPGALLRAVAAGLDSADRADLASVLLARYLAEDKAAAKGVLAVVAVGAGPDTVGRAVAFVREFHGQKASQSKALLAMLAHVDDLAALEALVAIAYRFKAPSIQRAAVEQVEAAARRRGWTEDQLADRAVATGGFDRGGRLLLPYGGRDFEAVLRPDLTVGLLGPDGRELSSLPAARVADDAELVAAAKATLVAARKQLKATVAQQTVRLADALATQRAWSAADWRHDVLGHPVLARMAARLVWSGSTSGPFRPLDDGTLTDAEDAAVALGDDEAVTLAHAALLADDVVDAWRAHLADYEVAIILDQLTVPGPDLGPERLAGTALDDAAGARLVLRSLDRAAAARGYRRGGAGDGAMVDDYVKGYPALSIEVRLGLVDGFEVWDRTDVGIELGAAEVVGEGLGSLADVPPVLLAEIRRDLQAIAGAGSGSGGSGGSAR